MGTIGSTHGVSASSTPSPKNSSVISISPVEESTPANPTSSPPEIASLQFRLPNRSSSPCAALALTT